MMVQRIRQRLRAFAGDDSGTASVEFVIVFPVFFMMFLMVYESGMISLRNFALERGVDLAVRDVRVGVVAKPTRESLRDRICNYARIIPDCSNQLQIEMVQRDPRAWVAIDPQVTCIDRGAAVQPVTAFTNGGNNRLMFLRVCARIDPVLPTTGLGRAIVQGNSSAAANGSYALVATSAFVIEPFEAN